MQIPDDLSDLYHEALSFCLQVFLCGFNGSKAEFMATSPFTSAHWGNGTTAPRVTWSLATLPGELVTFAASISDSTYQVAVRKAFATWESVANIDFVEVADHLTNGIRLGWAYIDKPGDTLATANWRYSGTQIIEAEIRFDLFDTWQPQSGGGNIANFFSTAIHEIGHAIGLAHVEERSSIMYAYQTSVAALSAADVEHVQEIYGAAVPAVSSNVIIPANIPIAASATSEVFRFYNTDTGLHFYTNSASERDAVLKNLPNFYYEGGVFKVPVNADNGAVTDVYRFFDNSNGSHFYTASAAERDLLKMTVPQMQYEGAAFKAYANAGVDGEHHAVHRFLRTDTGTHFYTASEAEKITVEAIMPLFRYEGIAYFADA